MPRDLAEQLLDRLMNFCLFSSRELGTQGIDEVFIHGHLYDIISDFLITDTNSRVDVSTKAAWVNGLIMVYTPTGKVYIRRSK